MQPNKTNNNIALIKFNQENNNLTMIIMGNFIYVLFIARKLIDNSK